MQQKKKNGKKGDLPTHAILHPITHRPASPLEYHRACKRGLKEGGADPLTSNICSSLLAPLMRPNFAILDPAPLPPPPPPLDTSTPNLHQYLNRVFGGQKETLGVPLPQRLSYSRAATSERSLNGIAETMDLAE